jgi:hypothetical protein
MVNRVFKILVIALILVHGITIFPLVSAQNQSVTESTSVMNVILDDATRSLQTGNTTKALQNLRVLDQMISEINNNSSRYQASQLLVGDAIMSLSSNDTMRAILYINLTRQQLNEQNTSNQTSQLPVTGSHDFLTYHNPLLGISMQYPSDWSIRQYEYNPAVNNTVVGFYSPSQTASELGNISGVSGNFVPYLDIFVFGPKNISLNEIVNERLDTINGSSNFIINESKSIFLRGNQSAYSIVYTSTTQGEYFKKMQVYTSFDNKIYLISFTSQDVLFSNYSDTVRKMVDSFKSNNSTAL